jgi:hypothetical protein
MTGTPRDDLAGFIRDELQEAADGREDVAYEQIEAYVDGALDDVDREIFETRLADDPGLRAMVEDLRALRPALAPATASPARVVTFEPRADAGPARQIPDRSTAPRRWLLPAGLAAAAAVALLLWRPWTPAPTPPSQAQQRPPQQQPAQPALPAPAGPASPALTLALQDGGRTVGLTSDGTLAGFNGFGGDLQARLTETLQQGRLPASARAAQTVARAGELMSGDVRATPFVPVGPRATAVSSATPAFRWTALAGATAYRVRVVDDRLTTVAVSDPITTLTWRPEAPLPSRRVLTWQVEATTPAGARTTPEPPLAEARFMVLTPSERARVSEALATAGGSDLASAVVYAEAGLYDDADAALARVQRANPESPMAAALKADLSMRRFGRIAGR